MAASVTVHTHRTQGTERSKFRVFLADVVKLAVDSAVAHSPKGSAGLRKVYRIVQDRPKQLPTSLPSGNAKKVKELNLKPDMELDTKDFQEDMTNVKQQHEASVISGKEIKPQNQLPDEGTKCRGPLEIQKKRIFIRSRL